MPVLIVDDDGFLFRIFFAAFFKDCGRLFRDALVEFFTVFIVLVNVSRFLVRLCYIA